MGRTKGQLEKFDLRGLDKIDHLRILLRGEQGRKAGFSELEEFEDVLERFLTEPDLGHDLSEEEVFEMMESLSEYFVEVRSQIQGRLEELEFSSSTATKDAGEADASEVREIDVLRVLDGGLRSAEAKRHNSEAARNIPSVDDHRIVAFRSYMGLQRLLGRIPTRFEIDAVDPGGAQTRAVSRAVERMGLRMTDKRIKVHLERVLGPLAPLPLGRNDSHSTGLQISKALLNLSVQSPESNFMRLPLVNAAPIPVRGSGSFRYASGLV